MDTLSDGNYSNFSPIPSISGFIGILNHMGNTLLGAMYSPEDNMDHGKGAPLFLLVPGFSGNHATMRELGNNLGEKANVAYAPNFPLFNTASLREAAKILNNKIENILSLHGKNWDIRLVGFSNGGLIALDALRYNTTRKVSEVITMGTPFRGTPLASLITFTSQACNEINRQGGYLEGSKIGKQLDRLSVHIAGSDSIVPAAHQVPDKNLAQGKIKIIHHEGYQHTDFVSGKTGAYMANMILG